MPYSSLGFIHNKQTNASPFNKMAAIRLAKKSHWYNQGESKAPTARPMEKLAIARAIKVARACVYNPLSKGKLETIVNSNPI